MLDAIILQSVIAGVLASLACGLGALPLMIKGIDPKKHTGIGFAVAGGLMISASVFNLILPGLDFAADSYSLSAVLPVIAGMLVGALFMVAADQAMEKWGAPPEKLTNWGGRSGLLIFTAMTIHSIPEGVAVGVGYTADSLHTEHLGNTIAIAIGLHNIPEGLAVAIPMRAAGASISRCFWVAVLTSIPQPLAAIPASAFAWFFKMLMPGLMGFAAGAMIFLVVSEMLPDAFQKEGHSKVAWAFMGGFCAMMLVQVVLQ